MSSGHLLIPHIRLDGLPSCLASTPPEAQGTSSLTSGWQPHCTLTPASAQRVACPQLGGMYRSRPGPTVQTSHPGHSTARPALSEPGSQGDSPAPPHKAVSCPQCTGMHMDSAPAPTLPGPPRGQSFCTPAKSVKRTQTAGQGAESGVTTARVAFFSNREVQHSRGTSRTNNCHKFQE